LGIGEDEKSQEGRATHSTPANAIKLHSASFQVKGSRSQRKHTMAVMVGIRKVITVASDMSSHDKESASQSVSQSFFFLRLRPGGLTVQPKESDEPSCTSQDEEFADTILAQGEVRDAVVPHVYRSYDGGAQHADEDDL
jgi:hypothetical protein